MQVIKSSDTFGGGVRPQRVMGELQAGEDLGRPPLHL